MSNKENKTQTKVAKIPCTKLILNKHQSHVSSAPQTTKPGHVRSLPQGTAHTVQPQKPVLVRIQTIIKLSIMV
jgi:hypothetical protein